MTPGLSKDIWCHVWPYFSKFANHQIRHQATHKVGCQPGDCIERYRRGIRKLDILCSELVFCIVTIPIELKIPVSQVLCRSDSSGKYR